MHFSLKNFVFPQKYPRLEGTSKDARIAALIPSFKPDLLTLRLVEDLTRWNQRLEVYLVDDSTPASFVESHQIFQTVSELPRVTLLRTPVNRMKAGALNYGLKEILKEQSLPDVILTLDDDVIITKDTVRNLVSELLSQPHLGAVCSQCRVLNKDKNLLTRLQGLEYIGFNAARLSDEGFYQGPLVMHGMLTAFRTRALEDTGGFAERHLIEDYEITCRLKEEGWHVKAALGAVAWTKAPDQLPTFWRQRTRWAYGGLTILSQTSYWPAVIQDLIGHSLFLITLAAVAVSFLVERNGAIPMLIPNLIIGLSLLQLALWYGFQIWLMRFYPEKDIYDWLLRISLVPEFIYANVLTLVLIGAYMFLIFNKISIKMPYFMPGIKESVRAIRRIFRTCGYMESWGTRES